MGPGIGKGPGGPGSGLARPGIPGSGPGLGSILENSGIRAGSGLRCRAPGSRPSRIFLLRLNQKEHLREECRKRFKK